MNRGSRPAPAVVIALVAAILCAPHTYADESTGTNPVAPEAAPPHVARNVDSWAAAGLSEARLDLSRAYRLDQEPTAEPAVELAPPDKKPHSKLGKIFTIVGAGMTVGGVVMVAAGSNEDRIGDSNVAIDWKTTGIVWIGTGVALLIVGLIKR